MIAIADKLQSVMFRRNRENQIDCDFLYLSHMTADVYFLKRTLLYSSPIKAGFEFLTKKLLLLLENLTF
jgi:hypothetical protein